MQLRNRLILTVSTSVSIGILAVSGVLALLAWRSILTQAEAEGVAIARLLAQSATVSEQVVAEVGGLLDREMIAHGLLASHLADIADKAGMSDRMLSRRLMEITARSAIGEVWISDALGMLRAGSTDDSDEALSVATAAGLPENALSRLMIGTKFAEVLGVGKRPLGGMPMRYVGVRGVDGARAVLVGRDQAYIARLYQTLGVQRLLDALARNGAVAGLWVFGPDGRQLAASADLAPSPREKELIEGALSGKPSRAVASTHWISVAAAMPDAYGVPAGAALARLSTAPLDSLVRNYLELGGATALCVLLAGVALSVVTGRRIAAPMLQIADAAAAVDARTFVPGSLGGVATRRDELGHLARTFETMAEQVFAREELLEEQVRERTKELQLKNEQLDLAKRRLEADLDMAKLLQSTILPQTFPSDRGWSGTARMVPALQMAGDFYDYFALDADRLGLVIADVSGKGVAPAFFMAVSRAALQDAARYNPEPGACLTAANNRLCEQNPLDMFVTVFYAVIDARNGIVTFANGGHNQPYVVGTDGVARTLPLTEGIMLGVMPDMDYSAASLTLQPGETLFLYTDGVSEAMNEAQEEFGDRRLAAVLTGTPQLAVDEVLAAVTDAVRDFVGTAPQSDDITCLVVRYLGGRLEYAPRLPGDMP